MIRQEELQIVLESAWLPRRAIRRDSPCKLSSLAPMVQFAPELIDIIQGGCEGLGNYLSGTNAVVPCGGFSYDVVYGLVRSLVLQGSAAKVVHLMDLENPPEYRADINFMEGLSQCEFLGVLGFYDSNEAKPPGTRKVSHLLRELECNLILEVSDVLDAQTWWGQELVNSLGDIKYLTHP